MPKLKTNRSAAKRFKKTAGGYKFKRAFKNHILTKKKGKTIRQLRKRGLVGERDDHRIDQMMPYA